MKVIVGLGNPGARYARTRHNAGYLAVQALAARHRWRWQRKEPAWVIEAELQGEPVALALPQTFMNRAGAVMAPLQRRYDAREPSAWLVVCDEVQLPLGRLRLRGSGSSGGHHGLASILTAAGTEAMPRLRIGVGPAPAGADLSAYVLERFGRAEWRALSPVLARAADACEQWVTAGLEAAMNQCNVREAQTYGAQRRKSAG